jgi:hypothetical protein
MSMASPYEANIVQLSSGHITFNDPTKVWTPDDFPNLPSTSLGLTTRGRIEDATFSTIRLTNAITYESYEPSSIHASLQKSFLIAQNGDVTLEEAKMGYVSTFSAPFEANVVNFTPSTIGGAHINDIETGTPDTVTTAIAKLDAWIDNAFLEQPPAVQIVEHENTSMFAGLRWRNFNTYCVLDKFVPYVTSMVFLIGDPTSSNYLTLEVRNCTYFPYKTYRDGISPEGAPLVRLRLFSDDYAMTGSIVCKKSTLASNDIYIISESGNMTLPAVGPILSLENTDGVETYTTMSLYLPNMPLSYPIDTEIPVRVFYLNRTEGDVHCVSTTIIHTSSGAPDALQQIIPETLYTDAIQVIVERPLYSDAQAGLTDPYFSSYTTSYTFAQMATAHAGELGFQYGLPTPTTVPSSLQTSTSTYTQSDRYTASTQQISTTTFQSPILPGTVWSTSVIANNIGQHAGIETPGVYTSTLFPNAEFGLHISSVPLVATNPYVAQPNTLYTPIYTPGQGWSIGTPVDHAVVFISSPTYLTTSLSTSVQLNDPSYPGDRNPMIIESYVIDQDSNLQLSDTLILSSFNDRFILNTPQTSQLIGTVLKDTYSTVGYTDYFYQAQHISHTLVNTTSNASAMNTQEVFLAFTNTSNPGYNDPFITQTYSSPSYVFEVTSSMQSQTTDIIYTNTVVSTIAISGIYTPITGSILYIDMQGSNFTAGNYINSNFICAGLYLSTTTLYPITSTTCVYSNQIIVNAATMAEITSLPFPVDTLLTLSSIQLYVNDWVYTDPVYVQPLRFVGAIVSANPEQTQQFESTFSTLYVDTVSYNSYTNFTSTSGIYGQRVLSLLPRLEDPGTPTNMNDGISPAGVYGSGLDVSISSFIFMSTTDLVVSSAVHYNHTSSLSTFTTDPYSRELLYTFGRFIHPAGYNFTPFSGTALGNPSAFYPDFTYDMYFDENKGNRFASFLIEQTPFSEPTPIQYMMIAIHNPNFISTITNVRETNFFPTCPVPAYLMSSMRVHLHAKVIGNYDVGSTESLETSWLNCFKQTEDAQFDDSIYDAGACSAVYVPAIGSNAGYMYAYVNLNRRFYTKIGALIRVGISYDGSMYGGDPLTFDAVSVSFSD